MQHGNLKLKIEQWQAFDDEYYKYKFKIIPSTTKCKFFLKAMKMNW